MVRGMAAGKVPLEARLLELDSGLYIQAWQLIANSLQEAERITGSRLQSTGRSSHSDGSPADLAFIKSQRYSQPDASAETTAEQPQTSRRPSLALIGLVAICTCILIAGSAITLAVVLSSPESETETEQQNPVVARERVDEPRSPEAGTAIEDEQQELRDQLAEQRLELERLRRKLEAEELLQDNPSAMNQPLDTGISPELEEESVTGDFADIVEKLNPSIFLIYVEIPLFDNEGNLRTLAGTGTGWLIQPNLLVTNKHVLFSFLFDAGRCGALEAVTHELGWSLDLSGMLVAAFPTGARIRDDERRPEEFFRDAWLLNGNDLGFVSRGSLSVEALLPDLMVDGKWELEGSSESVRIHAGDSPNDLALLRIQGGGASDLKPIPVATNSELQEMRQMDELLALGFPLGLHVAKGRSLQTSPALGHLRHYEAERNALVSSASVHHGCSGGPMIDREGKVVGIMTRGFESDLNESIDVSRANDLVGAEGIAGDTYLKHLQRRFSASKMDKTELRQDPDSKNGEPPSEPAQRRKTVPISEYLTGWMSIKEGMSMYDVRKAVGEPGEEGADSISIIWRYPDRNGGRVYFDPSTELVTRWKSPWKKLERFDSAERVVKLLGSPGLKLPADEELPTRGDWWIYNIDGEIYGVIVHSSRGVTTLDLPD